MGQPQARLYLGLTAAPPARLIEPVAEVFGDLDTQIDGRWQNPVTKKSPFAPVLPDSLRGFCCG